MYIFYKTYIAITAHKAAMAVETEIREITGASMLKGLAIAGTTAQNDRNTAEDAVEAWLQECLK